MDSDKNKKTKKKHNKKTLKNKQTNKLIRKKTNKQKKPQCNNNKFKLFLGGDYFFTLQLLKSVPEKKY